MKTKVNKIAKTIAVGIFFMALFLNVKVSLDDPFVRIDNAALAQTSGQQSCDAQYTQHFILTSMGKWCGSYFTFWQDCIYERDKLCPCSYQEEENCM